MATSRRTGELVEVPDKDKYETLAAIWDFPQAHCYSCGKQFKNRDTLRRHMRDARAHDPALWRCVFARCDKGRRRGDGSFTRKYSVKQHLIEHHDMTPQEAQDALDAILAL